LLIEEARTNSISRSVDFANAGWSKTSVTVTANTDIAPDGTTTASTITDSTTSAGDHLIGGGGSLTGLTDASIVTFSVFLKKTVGASNFPALRILYSGGTAFQRTIVVNTNTGAFAVSGSPDVGSVENVGAYWRVALTASNGVGNTSAVGRIYPAWNSTGTTTVDGTVTGSVVAWGAQLEAGAFPTSYIPTTTAAATRSADSAVVTPIASFYNQSEGTFLVEATYYGKAPSVFSRIFGFGNLTAGDPDRWFFGFNDSNTNLLMQHFSAGVFDFGSSASSSAGTIYKAAFALALNNGRSALNGSLLGSDDTSVGAPSNKDRMNIGGSPTGTSNNGLHIRRIAYYPRRLSNTLLQQLTT
jgi:hypothetical protein